MGQITIALCIFAALSSCAIKGTGYGLAQQGKCYAVAQAFQVWSNSANKNPRDVLRALRSKFLSDDRTRFSFVMDPGLSLIGPLEFIEKPKSQYKKCIAEQNQSYPERTLSTCMVALFYMRTVDAYMVSGKPKQAIFNDMQLLLGDSAVVLDFQMRTLANRAYRNSVKYKTFMLQDFNKCLINRQEHDMAGTVTKVLSGDSFEFDNGKAKRRFHLLAVKAPSVGEYFFNESKAFLSAKIENTRQKLTYHRGDDDVYYARLHIDNKDLSATLLSEGMVKYDRQALDTSFYSYSTLYATSPLVAKITKKGIWADSRLPKTTP